MSASVQHELLSQCLDLTKQLISLDQKAAINVRIGNEFVFSFSNQETLSERKKSPSQIKRNLERKATFENMKKENIRTEKTETNALAATAMPTLDKKVKTRDTETEIDALNDKEDFNDKTNDKINDKINDQINDKSNFSDNKEIRPKENETILEMGLNHEDLDESKVEKYITKRLKLSLIGTPWIANNGRHYVTVGFKTKTSDFETLKTNTVNWHDSGRIRAVTFSRRHQ